MAKKIRKKKSTKKPKDGIWSRILAHFDAERMDRWGRRLGKLALLGLAGALLVWGFTCLESYVHDVAGEREVRFSVEFKNRPDWASEELIEKVCLSTGIRSDDFLLDETLANKWALNLAHNPWVKQVKLLRKRYDGRLEIDCELRRPIASLKKDAKVYFVDADGVVLPAIPLTEGAGGHLVQLRGARYNIPQPGERLNSPSLLAGIEVLTKIRKVDEQLPRTERLWNELAVMDVSNHEGKISSADAHLVMYTDNQTEIRWGAAVNRSRPFYEAPAEVKLVTLYKSYKKHGTLRAYEYVDLRDQRKEKADPLRQSG
jgi:hypothetical protein